MSILLDFTQVREAVAEGPPHLMVDRMELADDLGSARGIKAVTMGEPFFQGHFPSYPILPGVLQIASMLQVGGVLLSRRLGRDGRIPRIKELRRVKFRRPILPGFVMIVELVVKDAERSTCTLQAKTTVDGTVSCQATLVVELVDPASILPEISALDTGRHEGEGLEGGEDLDVRGVMQAIPHRHPFLLTDRVVFKDIHAVGLKNVSGNEPYFAGLPVAVMPEYLVVEAAAQTGAVVVLTRPGNVGQLAFFMSIDKAVFHRPVCPGDRLVMDMTYDGRGRFGLADGQIFAGSALVCDIELKFAVVDQEGNA